MLVELPGPCGLGSNVSNWLGPPASHNTMMDFAGVPRGASSAARVRASATGVSQPIPLKPAAFSNVRRCRWLPLPQPIKDEEFIAGSE